MVSPTSSSFYTDGEQVADGVVVDNDYTPSTTTSQAPSSLYPNGTAYEGSDPDVAANYAAQALASAASAAAHDASSAVHDTNAATSATNANTSETASAAAAAAALVSENNSSGHDTASAASAAAAHTSETNAASSASTATTQAGIATTQASNSTTSASQALASKNAAATSETNAHTSEVNAAASAAVAAAGVAAAAGTATPLVDGTAAVGTSAKWSHEDHTHPTDTSRADASATTAALATKANVATTIAGYGITDHIAYYSTAQSWTKQQTSTIFALTDGTSIGWDVSGAQKAKVTLGGNRTMSAVTNAVEGTTYFLWVIQDATGSRTLSWTTTGAGAFDFGAAGAPTLTTTANKADLICFEAITIGGTLKLRYAGIMKGFS